MDPDVVGGYAASRGESHKDAAQLPGKVIPGEWDVEKQDALPVLVRRDPVELGKIAGIPVGSQTAVGVKPGGQIDQLIFIRPVGKKGRGKILSQDRTACLYSP